VVWERILNREVARINDNDLYVDEMALHIWSTAVGARELQTYRDVKQRVAAMFQVLAYNGGNDEVIKWVNELRPYLRP
jgi:acyl-coenzyme A synthetase/AMP-(fatty) acid ligase